PICGLNICAVYSRGKPSGIGISNKTNGLNWSYNPTIIALPDDDKPMIWLSHWKINACQLEMGDDIAVGVCHD
ncbi:unnamed protein product, partial [Ilex paraguariensis]